MIVKYVRSDNGTKFKHIIPYFTENGILFQRSCVGTPQQNGRVERKHQHILNVGRALRFQGNLPIGFWGECILGAVYLINRTPSRLLANKTPYLGYHQILMSCVFLVVSALRIIKSLRGISSHLEVENVFFLGTLMVKKVGRCMI